MMMFLKIFFGGLLLLLIGGFAYFAFMDVPVKQSEKTITLSAEEFQKGNR